MVIASALTITLENEEKGAYSKGNRERAYKDMPRPEGNGQKNKGQSLMSSETLQSSKLPSGR